MELAKRLDSLGYVLIATSGTAKEIELANPEVSVQRVKKLAEGHPNLLDHLVDHDVSLILNTPSGKGARTDEGRIRAAAVQAGVPCITTIQAAEAVVKALEALTEAELTVLALQDRFAMV